MAVYLSSIVGSASIGVYSLATDNFVIIPKMVPQEKAERTAEWLKAKLVQTSVSGSVLVGALVCANSNGILVPSSIRGEELEMIESDFEGRITVMETKKTAYGNLVLANDFGALVDPRFREQEIDIIARQKDILVFVEVKTRTSDKFGKADEAMGSRKTKNLRQAVKRYLYNYNNEFNYKDIRADLIAVDIDKSRKVAKIKHYRNII